MNRLLLAVVVASLGCASQPRPQPRLADFPDPSPRSCTPIDPTAIGRVDVAIAIDTSRSSADMTGLDLNGNGRVGKPKLVRHRDVFDITYSDSADSFFAAQVVAARSLIRSAAGAQVIFSIVSFSGADAEATQPPKLTDHARIEVPPTEDVGSLEDGLSRVLARGTGGMTDFAAAMRAATATLGDARQGSVRRVVLFMSDSTFPSVVGPDGTPRFDDPNVKDAAAAALAADVVFHTFRLGTKPAPGSRAQARVDYLRDIASATRGTYSAVTEANQLHCALARALAP